jgi:hypothetical protein
VPLPVVRVLGGVAIRPADECLLPPRADLGEARVLLDLDPPPLVLGEVPVERVHFVEREEVDVLLHELLRHEVTRDVEVPPAPAEAWDVLDRDRGHRPGNARDPRAAKDLRREELPYRLDGVEQACRFRRLRDDAIGPHVEPVALRAERLRERRVPPQLDASIRRVTPAAHLERETGRRREIRRELSPDRRARVIRRDDRLPTDHEHAAPRRHARRLRDDGDGLLLPLTRARERDVAVRVVASTLCSRE